MVLHSIQYEYKLEITYELICFLTKLCNLVVDSAQCRIPFTLSITVFNYTSSNAQFLKNSLIAFKDFQRGFYQNKLPQSFCSKGFRRVQLTTLGVPPAVIKIKRFKGVGGSDHFLGPKEFFGLSYSPITWEYHTFYRIEKSCS